MSIEMGIRLHEPAVALTDLAVCLEAAAFAVALARPGSRRPFGSPRSRRSRPAERPDESGRWFVIFFASTSVAAFAGAALHGLFPSDEAPARRWLWRLSLGSIGIAGLSAWCLGAVIALPERIAGRVRRAAILAHAAYLVALVRTSPPYSVAIAAYVPGSLALGLALINRMADRSVRRPVLAALAGLGLTFGAAIAQLGRIAVHPRLFNHNATYHAIQAIALACFFRAAGGFTVKRCLPLDGPAGQPGVLDGKDQPVGRR